MDTINNPYEPQENQYNPAQTQYNPQQAQYNPAQQPPQAQWQPPQQAAPPQPAATQWQPPAPGGQPPSQQTAPTQWGPPPQQGQPQWGPPAQQQAPAPQRPAPQQSQIVKLAPTKGQMQRTNLSMIEGWINGRKATTLNDGSIRLGFFIVWEELVYEGGQQKFNAQGYPEVRDRKYLCQAWGQIATNLSQLPEGTAIKIYGTLNRWNASRDQNNPNWITDIKVNRYDLL
jgi:hypothetical protein